MDLHIFFDRISLTPDAERMMDKRCGTHTGAVTAPEAVVGSSWAKRDNEGLVTSELIKAGKCM